MSILDKMKEEGLQVTLAVKESDLRLIVEEAVQRVLVARDREKSQPEKEYLTTEEVMSVLGVSRPTLSRWSASGYLTPAKAGGRCRYAKSEVTALLETKK